MIRFKSLAAAFLLGLATMAATHAAENTGSVRPAAVQHLINNTAADWKLDVRLNHGDGLYVVGEKMTIEVNSPRNCYVHIVNVNPEGEVNVLWPMDAQTSNRVVSGTTVIFPDRTNHPGYVFEAAAPVGKELIVCFATTAPLNLKSSDDAQMFGDFLNEVKEISPHPLTRLRSFVTKVEPEKNGWTATAFELVTTEKDDSTSNLPNTSPEKPSVSPDGSILPDTPPSSGQGLYKPAGGAVTVQFPGAYVTHPSTMDTVFGHKIKTTCTLQTDAAGVMMFSENVFESPIAAFDLQAALNSVSVTWMEQYQANADQIKTICLGRMEGREFRGTAKDGTAVWLRIYVDPVAPAAYTIGCLGTASLIDSPASLAFLDSLKEVR